MRENGRRSEVAVKHGFLVLHGALECPKVNTQTGRRCWAQEMRPPVPLGHHGSVTRGGAWLRASAAGVSVSVSVSRSDVRSPETWPPAGGAARVLGSPLLSLVVTACRRGRCRHAQPATLKTAPQMAFTSDHGEFSAIALCSCASWKRNLSGGSMHTLWLQNCDVTDAT